MTDQSTATEASRQATEMILQDERLTSSLEDSEADVLLHWATSRAGQVVAGRIHRGQPVDHAAIAEAILPVRRVARAVNDLVAGHTAMGCHEFLSRLLALLDLACRPGPDESLGTPTAGSSSPPA